MAFTIPTNTVQIQRFAQSVFGVQLGSVTLGQINSDVLASTGGLDSVLNGYFSSAFAGVPVKTVAAAMAENLGIVNGKNGLTEQTAAEALAYISGVLSNAPAGAQGAAAKGILNLWAALSTDATYGAASTAWNTGIDNAVSYAANNAGNVAAGTVLPAAAQIFTLTNANNPTTGGADNVSGTTGNDKINGVIDLANVNSSFGAADIIDGSDGIDTLGLTVTGTPGVGAVSPAGITSNVEIINIANASSSNAASLNFSTVTGATSLNVTSSLDNAGMTVTGLLKIADIGVTGSGALTVTYDNAAVVGTADVQKLSLNGVTEGVSKTNTVTVDGVETVAVTANKESKVSLVGNSVKTLTVAGSAKSQTFNNSATLKTVDASAATGDTTVIVGTTAAAVTSIKGGTGNDTLVVLGNLTKDIAVDGGDGKDALAVGNTAFATDAFANVKNVESVLLNASSAYGAPANVTVDLKSVTGLTSVGTAVSQTDVAVAAAVTAVNALTTTAGAVAIRAGAAVTGAEILTYQEGASGDATRYATAVNGANGGAVTVSGLASGATISLSSKGAKAVFETDPTAFDLLGQGVVTANVFNATLPANVTDSLTIDIANNSEFAVKNTALGALSAAKNLYVVDGLTAAGVETININSTGSFGGNTITALTATSVNKIVVTGNQTLTIGTSSANGITSSATDSVTFDASAMTGRLNLTVNSVELGHYDKGLVAGTGTTDTLTVVGDATASVAPKTTGFETVTFRPLADTTTSFDFTGVTGSTKQAVTFPSTAPAAGAAGATAVTVTGLSAGAKVSVQGTAGNDNFAVQGAGNTSALRLNFDSDGTAFATNALSLTRVGDLTIDTTRLDGSDSNTTVVQNSTNLGSVTGATLKTLTVVGATDTANVLTLGSINNATVSLLTKVDMSAFGGNLANGGLDLSGESATSKDVVITLNKATSAGTAPVIATEAGIGNIVTTVAVGGIVLGTITPDAVAPLTVRGATTVDNVAETIKFDSGFTGNVVITGFTKGTGANISTKVDKLDLSSLGLTLSDLTITNFANQAQGAGDQPDDSVQITSTLFSGTITLVGVIASELATTNFIFA
jgi:hypothetical protein